MHFPDRYRIVSALLALALCGSGVVLAASSYTQTFDGTPATPQSYQPLTDWDVTVHSDNINPATWLQVAGSPLQAHHGPGCQAPMVTHLVDTYEGAVFQCANHMMTALFADGGYGVIYLTPPQMLDWSAGEAVLRWDMSTLRTSTRDWVDVWISPYADALQLPLEDWLPDLQGPPRNAVHLRMDNSGGSMFRTMVVRDFVTTEVSGGQICCVFYEQVLTPDAARRDTFELHLSATHIKFGMPAYNLWWMDGDIADLGWTQGVVQLGHHSYNPLKACEGDGTCGPDTWHWDNVTLSNAVPFTIEKVSPRAVSDQSAPALVFDAPAPDGASLHFAALGTAVQVSFDGGGTWVNAPAASEDKHDSGHFDSYQVPLPAGLTTVQVRAAGGWWGGQWQARDFSVWSQIDRPRPTGTPTPRPNTPTATPVVPTSTVTLVPTATLGPTSTPPPTPTLLPTSTPMPDATATPAPIGPQCALVSIVNGGLVWSPQAIVNCPQG